MAVHQKVHEDAKGPHVYHVIVLLTLAEGDCYAGDCSVAIRFAGFSMIGVWSVGKTGTWIHHWLKRETQLGSISMEAIPSGKLT